RARTDSRCEACEAARSLLVSDTLFLQFRILDGYRCLIGKGQQRLDLVLCNRAVRQQVVDEKYAYALAIRPKRNKRMGSHSMHRVGRPWAANGGIVVDEAVGRLAGYHRKQSWVALEGYGVLEMVNS